MAASTPVAVADATPEIEAVAPADGESVPTDDVAATPAIPFDTPVVVVPATVETWLPVTALDTAGNNVPAAAVLAVPDTVVVAPADGDSEPTTDVAETPEIEVERLSATAPVLDAPALPAKAADASPPAESGIQTNNSSGIKTCKGSRAKSACSESVRWPSKNRIGPWKPSKLRTPSLARLPNVNCVGRVS